jgi:hypothetical protein
LVGLVGLVPLVVWLYGGAIADAMDRRVLYLISLHHLGGDVGASAQTPPG